MLRKVAQKLRNTDFYEIILILIILTGIISLSFADNMSEAIIHNTGKIIPEISAKSGSARDIQAAVDLVAAIGGIVHIPEGTFNFVEVGETWSGAGVTIPAGVSIFGAPTERDENGQVIGWKTVLVMPSEVPGNDMVGIPTWFRIVGDSDPNKPSRFSDIKLVGYRSIDNSSTSMHRAISIDSVINYRVDHCYFENTCAGIGATGHYCSGVIDHCYLVNTNGVPDPYASRTVGYGITFGRTAPCYVKDDIEDVVGHYRNYTHFIEDCYFSRWRHCTAGNWGAHYVVRHSTIQYGFAYGEVDAHPVYDGTVGCRAVESYENQFKDPNPWTVNWAGQISDGGGCMFNNTLSGYGLLARLNYCEDFYIWNNTGAGIQHGGNLQENVNYFLYEPGWYTPYTYPHPLTK